MMKLFVWKDYRCVFVALANDAEEAREAIAEQQKYKPELLKERPEIFDPSDSQIHAVAFGQCSE